ncbi:MAG TPA: hypothetical protein VNW99_02005 [Cytophagaceae bacterium]|jgi:hypothetical protein|nr:hypothetical protein [Cytophagaceae bacterium]
MDNNKEFKEERDKIIKGLELAYKKLVEFKKQKNSPLVVSENGKILELDPKDISPTTLYKRKL